MSCAMDSYLGAYVLDALEPAETEDVRRHLATCPACRDTVRELQWIPGVLAAVPPYEALALEDPAGTRPASEPVLLDRVLAEARHRRRTGRRRFVLAAAATVVALAGAATVPLSGHDRPAPVVRATSGAVTAEVSLDERGEGTQLGLRLSGVEPGERCSLVARARDGRTETAATWVATYTGTAEVSGTTGIARDRLAALDVVTDDGRLLVRLDVPAAR